MIHAIGFDIGGTRVKAGLVDEAGRITSAENVPTPTSLPAMRDLLRNLSRQLWGGEPERVGLGCRGVIDYATTRVASLPGSLHYLEGTVLKDCFPPDAVVAADNDARAAMAGEMTWGAARGLHNALMLTLGTGVGGAIISEGRLVRGARSVAGHIGHLTIDPDGPLCICGNRGCIETFFSSKAIESAAFAAIHRGSPTAIRQPQGQPPDCEAVFAAARQGDSIATEIVQRATFMLAGALAGLIHTLDPEQVIIGGQISTAGDILFEPLRAEVWRRTEYLLMRQVPVIPSRLSDPSGVAGAAALAMQQSARQAETLH